MKLLEIFIYTSEDEDIIYLSLPECIALKQAKNILKMMMSIGFPELKVYWITKFIQL